MHRAPAHVVSVIPSMKKKKRDNESPADFKNNPFKPLKGFAPRPASAPKTGTPPRRREAQTEDDGELFLRAAAGARRIAQEDDPAADTVLRNDPARPDAAAAKDRELFLQALQ